MSLDITVYFSENNEENRYAAHGGNRGKDGSQPLSYKSIVEMSNEHINNILKDMKGRIAPYMESIMTNELFYKLINNINIDD